MSTKPPHEHEQFADYPGVSANASIPVDDADPPPSTELSPETNTAASLSLTRGECDALLQIVETDRLHESDRERMRDGSDMYDSTMHNSYALLRLKLQRAVSREVELVGEDVEMLRDVLRDALCAGVVCPEAEAVVDRL